MSGGPNGSLALAAISPSKARSDKSAGKAAKSSPNSSFSDAKASARRAIPTTFAPAAAKATADLRPSPALAPVTVGLLPLSKKLQPELEGLERELRRNFSLQYDHAGNIGRRYRRQDEIGTPWCVTYDFESADDRKVTVRQRDSMEQERVAIEGIVAYLRDALEAAS